MADMNRPGIRVAVQEKSGPDSFFSRTLKNAVVIRASSNRESRRNGQHQASPVRIVESVAWFSGLDGRPGIDPHAMAMPKARDPGVAYARQFIEDAKSEGLVKAAIERAGLRGVIVAPLK